MNKHTVTLTGSHLHTNIPLKAKFFIDVRTLLSDFGLKASVKFTEGDTGLCVCIVTFTEVEDAALFKMEWKNRIVF